MLFTRKSLISLIVPLILQQALAIAIGMIDTIMVASCGEAAVSGVSLVDSLNGTLVQLFTGLSAGGVVVTAQYVGKRDLKNGCESANQLILSVTAMSLVVTVAALLFRRQILDALYGSIEPEVMKNAMIYFLLTALSYPFLSLESSGAALFRAMGNSKISLYTSTIMNMINICGNALFVFVFKMGAAGVGLATLISRVFGGILFAYMLTKKENTIHLENFFPIRFKWGMIKRILRIAIPGGLETALFTLGGLLVSSLVATFGTGAIAARAVATNISSIQMIPSGAIGLAIVTIVGQCVGAKEYEQAKHYLKKMLLLAILSSVVMGIFTCGFANQIVLLYSLTEDTAALAVKLILLCGVLSPVLNPLSFHISSALRAASDVRFCMVASIVSVFLVRVLLSYVFGAFLGWGIYGVYAGMYADCIVRAIVFSLRFAKGKWKGKADL